MKTPLYTFLLVYHKQKKSLEMDSLITLTFTSFNSRLKRISETTDCILGESELPVQ